jgi:uncharacterized protein YneF (UPF0154 family)
MNWWILLIILAFILGLIIGYILGTIFMADSLVEYDKLHYKY